MSRRLNDAGVLGDIRTVLQRRRTPIAKTLLREVEEASGLMLHPSIDEEIDPLVTTQNHKIRFVTVDLAQDPANISNRLLQIIEAQ